LLQLTTGDSQAPMVSVEELEVRLAAALPGATIAVVDTTGEGDHFDVRVRAATFAGLSLVDQHRLVYDALGDLMRRVHALSLRTEAA
jgi:stress-induced morphogen